MDKIRELIEKYGLSEDTEHVIIPYTRSDGEKRRIYLLYRPNMIIKRDRDHSFTVSLDEVIEALVRSPEGNLWDLLQLSARESEARKKTNEEPAGGDAEGEGNGSQDKDYGENPPAASSAGM